MKVALGLYTVFQELSCDMMGTLRAVKAIGYDGVEFYGPHQWPATEVKRALEINGLEMCGWHEEWKLLGRDTIEETMVYHQELCSDKIVIPCLGGPWNIAHTAKENNSVTWMRHADEMNELSEILKQQGMTLGYHTHAHEFEKLPDGSTPWQILNSHTSPDIFMELDTGNCIEGGERPEAIIGEMRRRLISIHGKPFGKERGTDTWLGSWEDENDWSSILRKLDRAGAEWLVIENEMQGEDKLKVAEKDFTALKKKAGGLI